jgi:hypothetical protein
MDYPNGDDITEDDELDKGLVYSELATYSVKTHLMLSEELDTASVSIQKVNPEIYSLVSCAKSSTEYLCKETIILIKVTSKGTP